MSELVPPLELEKYLNDNTRLFILHALDGEIWGASIATNELFGYSNDEFKQLYLASIKPKKLRLSDVCKTQKNEEAAVIFERRNGRRFTALVSNKILRTTLHKSTIDLVLLELELIQSNVVHFPKTPQVNLQEATDYVQTFCAEVQNPIVELDKLIKEIKTGPLTGEQLAIVEQIASIEKTLSSTTTNISDSLKLALNLLNLERHPFNIVDMIGELIPQWTDRRLNFSSYIDYSVPELVYGDEKRLKRICLNLLNRSCFYLNPSQIKMDIQSKRIEKQANTISFLIRLEGCAVLEQSQHTAPSTQNRHKQEQELDILARLANCSDIYLSKHLIRMMDGALRFDRTSTDTFDIEFSAALPEVHDLGLKGDKRFLEGQQLILVDNCNSLLRHQLSTWGAQIEHYRTIGAAVDYLQSHGLQNESLIVIHLLQKPDLDLEHIDKITQTSNGRVLLVKPRELELNLNRVVFQIPTPYQPGMLGNVLSQFVHKQFPFPYSNSHKKRRKEIHQEATRILVVDDSEDTRLIAQKILAKKGFEVDVAVNGIDAVLACAHNQYDVILMDIHLPYMDGFEALTHLRKVSELNTLSKVIITSSDTSENARLMMQQVGVDGQIEKPLDGDQLVRTLGQLTSDTDTHPTPPLTHNTDLGRRSNDNVESLSPLKTFKAIETPVNAEIIQRLENDTNSDVCREMVDMFIEESLIALGEVEKSCMNGDWESVASHAHSICSSSMTFGCEALYDLAQQLKNESLKNNLNECMRLAAQLPEVFLKSQQSLYTICNRNFTGK